MRTFKDNAGRSWSVSVNVETARQIRTMAHVDLMELVERQPAEAEQPKRSLLERLIRDPILLCDVLYVVCKDQADQLGVSDADFGRALYGTAITAGRTALLEEIADFFPDEGPALRSQANKILSALRLFVERMDLRIQARDEVQLVETVLAHLAAKEAEEEAEAMAALGADSLPPTPGTLSTSLPASAASTPPG
jgi:hypothetical protein